MFRFLNRSGSLRGWVFFLLEDLLVFSSVYVSAILRFHFEFDSVSRLPYFIPRALLITFVCQASLYYHDLNFANVGRFRGNLFLKLIQVIAVSFFILSLVYYAFPPLETGRGILLIDAFVLIPIFFFLRVIFLQGARSETFGERAVIVGTGRLARQIGQSLYQRPELGYKVIGFIDEKPENVGMTIINPKVIGVCADLFDLVRKHKVQSVITALPEQRGNLPVGDLLECKLQGVKVLEGVSFLERLKGKITVEELKPSWVIFSDGFHIPRSTVVLKRALDIGLSLVGLIFFFPLGLIIGMLVKLDSRGPVFYMQERVGEQGRIFTLLKFRSMRVDAESETGPVWTKKGDKRITRIGRPLRQLRLDELPQIFNILKGDMSIVGPRPERPAFVEQLKKENPYYALRLIVKPGLTGWAQVSYRYGSTPKQAVEKLQYDLFYIKNLSTLFDLYIIFMTVKTVLMGNGAR